jgi:hypothetical protein
MNTPFFACHFLGILLTGICFDIFFSVFKLKNKSLSSIGTVYLSYAAFALMITYLFRYDYWAQAGFANVVNHIGIGGTFAAALCAVAVPLTFQLGHKLKTLNTVPLNLRLQLAKGGISVATMLIWVFGVVAYVSKI